MDVRGLERHANLLQYVNDIELRLAEYEQGKCSFEKVAINFRWCVEYILREYQKEYPACAAEDSFGTIKNLQDLCLVERSGADALHQARKIGNKGGAHLTDEVTDAKTVRAAFSLLLDFLPAFLERFPEPSKKALPKHQAMKVQMREVAERWINTGEGKYTIELLEPVSLGDFKAQQGCDLTEVEHFIMSNEELYINVPGIIKATRSMIDAMKMRKMENTFIEIPGVAQSSLGFSVIAYCAEPDNSGYGNRKKRYWAYGRPNKMNYFFDVAPFVHTLTLPSCFAEDAFDSWNHSEAADESYYLEIKKLSWADYIEMQKYIRADYAVKTDPSYAALEAFKQHHKFLSVRKLVLPEDLQPAALSWLNLFPDLEEIVLPSTMYMEDGVIYSKLGDQILALLRGKVKDTKINEFLLGNFHTYVYPGADWGSGYEIQNRLDDNGRFLRSEGVIKSNYIHNQKEAEREAKRQEEAYWKEVREKQKTKQAQQAAQAAPQKTVGGNSQQQRSGSAQTSPGNQSKRLCKSGTDRWFTGVCGGIANYLGLPSSLVRVVFGILGFSGLGFWVYVLLALFLPKDTDI